ncbi:hypothetical protein B0H17DRAFT_1093157 [Mycena rosella]|uniref:Uncharacterized protein n=1 Tax=Mycena rosella TaxID=1033263 RepID=A0AAD7CTQ9_MYCRO|nr:hypothetical protein B0H17DRAFT_1093157 [Mycena rosella]
MARATRRLALLALFLALHSPGSQAATPTTSSKSYQITPPVACPGLYYTYGGVCCTGNTMLDCSYSDIADGFQTPSSCCPPGAFGWALPLSDAQIAAAQANGTYTGCPGNMRLGLCCSGGIIYEDDSGADVCSLGTAVFTATTLSDGRVSTSSFPPGPTSSEPSRITSVPTPTSTGAAAGASLGLDVRILGGAAVALGALL